MRSFRFPSVCALFVVAAWALTITPLAAHEPWAVWQDCRLQENDSNDGDSFHIKAGGREYIFRLYFVDAPETDAGFPDRVTEQAKYFGITPQQSTQLGEYAKKFAAEKMARPFTVRTCKQNAMGRSNKQRYYAFVETSEGDLGELLVANGMARVHGVAALPVGLTSPRMEKQKLQRLEREARQLKVGGWGAAAGRMTVRVLSPPARVGLDSFDAFFHPERVAAASAPPAPPASVSPTAAAAPGTLDVNTSTLVELMGIKGVGPVIANRIMEARPFKSADELRRVKGIGAKRYERIRPYFGL